MPTAFITGITGQDGSYLAELLLAKSYQVVGLVSLKHNIGTQNIEKFQQQIVLEDGDLLDKASLKKVINKYHPDEIYNLAGLSFPPASWEKPTLTFDINTLGVTRLLEILVADSPKTKFYQASSSKIFGNPIQSPQTESTLINPLDPYSASKAAAHFVTRQFRQHFHLFACAGIMFNHESERRGPEFVTRKITQAAANIKLGRQQDLKLGDLEAKQDWGYAPDYVQAMWLMLQQDQPDDYIIASGENHSVTDICDIAFSHLGLNYRQYVVKDPQFVRREKITTPLGDPTKAKTKLNWQPKVSFQEMIVKMVENDLKSLKLPPQETGDSGNLNSSGNPSK